MTLNSSHTYGTVEITQKVGISAERLRYWERAGVVNPRYAKRGTRRFRRFSQKDLHRAIFVKTLVDCEKYTLEGALKRLNDE